MTTAHPRIVDRAAPTLPSPASGGGLGRGFDPHRLRSEFPIFANNPGLVFLDSGASAQKPALVIDGVADYYRTDYANVHRGVYRLSARSTELFEEARVKVQRFLNAADPREIVFVRGATEAINLVAQSWGGAFLEAGDEVVISELEHHSNIVPWQILRDRIGFRIVVAPIDATGGLDLAAFAERLTPRTRLVAITHLANATGALVPVESVIELAHRAGAKVLIDGCQAAPRLQVDVQALGCDFYAFSGHKIYGPTGIGVLYGRHQLLSAMPPWQGGGEMILNVTFAETTFQEPPHRFEAGTPGYFRSNRARRRARLCRGAGARQYSRARGGADRVRRRPSIAYSGVAVDRRRAAPARHFVLRSRRSAPARSCDGARSPPCGGARRASLRPAAAGKARLSGDDPRLARRLQRRGRHRQIGRRNRSRPGAVCVMDLRELYQDIILDHGRRPRNFRAIDNPTHTAQGYNPLCGDRVTIYLTLDGDHIADVAFQGRGCAISTAAASLMTEVLKGKTIAEAQELFAHFHARVTGGEDNPLPEPLAEEMERLEPLTGVKAYPARVKCATLSWHALEAALKGAGDAPVRTE